MSDCTWSLFLFNSFGVPKRFKPKVMVLLRLIPDGINVRNMNCLEVLEKLGYNTHEKLGWQYDKDQYLNQNVRGGCGSCWDYFANHSEKYYSFLFKDLPKTFDLEAISKLECVLILDENGNEINDIFSSHSVPTYGATCKKCNDYNPYAETTAGEDYLCYKCRNGY